MAVEGSDRGEDERALGEIAGVVDEIARGEIVGAVGDDVVAGDDLDGVLRLEPRGVEARLDMRVQALDALCRASRLVGAGACRVVHDLPLEIVEADAVVVDDADLADARGGEIEEERRAEAAGADHQHLGVLQPLLSFAADLFQHQLALVALDLVRGEHDGNIYAIPRLSPAAASSDGTSRAIAPCLH